MISTKPRFIMVCWSLALNILLFKLVCTIGLDYALVLENPSKSRHFACVRNLRSSMQEPRAGFPRYSNVKMVRSVVVVGSYSSPCRRLKSRNKAGLLLRESFNGAVVIVTLSERCSMVAQVLNIQRFGAEAIMLAIDTDSVVRSNDFKLTDRLLQQIRIPVGLITTRQLDDILTRNTNRLGLYDPSIRPTMNIAVVAIGFTTIACILMGMFWGLNLFHKEVIRLNRKEVLAIPIDAQGDNDIISPYIDINILEVFGGIMVICLSALLHFVHIAVIFYILALIFILLGSISLTLCFKAVVELAPGKVRKFVTMRVYTSTDSYIPDINISLLISFPVALSLVILFCLLHNTQSHIWILRNMIVMSMIVVCLAYFRMTKIGNVMMFFLVFLIYDIFFAYVAPKLEILAVSNSASADLSLQSSLLNISDYSNQTQPRGANGSSALSWEAVDDVPILSVIQTVSSQSLAYIHLPVVITYPYFRAIPDPCKFTSDACVMGLGAVLVPGFLAVFCAMYDHIKLSMMVSNSRRPRFPHVYSVSFIFSYSVGLLLAFVVMANGRRHLPSLLLITPVVSLTFIAVALYEQDVNNVLRGTLFNAFPTFVHAKSRRTQKPKTSANKLLP